MTQKKQQQKSYDNKENDFRDYLYAIWWYLAGLIFVIKLIKKRKKRNKDVNAL